MPQPAEVHALADSLVSAYRGAWERVVAEQQKLLSDPLSFRRRMRLAEVRRSIEDSLEGLDDQAAHWVANQLPKAFLAGAAPGGLALAEMWNLVSQEAVQELANNLFHDLLDATLHVRDTTKTLIRKVARDEALQKAIEGKTAQQAGREMRRVLEEHGIHAVKYANGAKHGLAEYSEMAMRTTTAKAYNTGTLSSTPDVQFYEIFDGPNCGLTYHEDPTTALGLVVDRSTALGNLISHPNAVMAGTSVCVLGRATGAYSARWEGPAVRLATLGGRRLTVGPNHPVLTNTGWVRAEDLREGDQVVCQRRSSRAVTVEENIHDCPPLVEEVFKTLGTVGLHSRVIATPVHLHGDGNFCEGEVSIVDVDGVLTQVANTALIQEYGELVLNDADPQHPLVASLRSLPFGLDSVEGSSSSFPHRAQISGVGVPGTYRDAPLNQDPFQRSFSDPDLLRDLSEGLACEIELDSLVLVESDTWSGHAYDLETSTAMYVADGIVVHNCRRSFGARPDITTSEQAKEAATNTTPGQRQSQLEQDASRGDREARAALRGQSRADRLAARQARTRRPAKDTREAYTANGVYTPERQALHDGYLQEQMKVAVRVPDPEYRIMGGGAASGKSSLLQSGDVVLPRGHVMANADEAKDVLPEYRQRLAAKDESAASYVHEESSDMVKRLTDESLRSGYHTVLDGVGNGEIEDLARKIQKGRDAGARRIVGDYVTVDTDEALRRAIARGERIGRFVPEEAIRQGHVNVSKTFYLASRRDDLFDELRLWDNNGEAPRLIYEKINGVERILDRGAWERFLNKNPDLRAGSR